jgi:hypothetical protein
MIKSGANKDKVAYLTSLAGFSNFSYAYYIAKLHAALGKQVMLIDNSAGHELFRTVTRDEDVDVGESKNLVCLTDVGYSPEPFSRVDEVIIWHGKDIDSELWQYSDLRILFTTYNKFDIEKLRSSSDEIRKDVHLVFVDRAIGITPEKKVADILNIGKADVYTDLGHQIVDYDITDAACYQGLVYNGLQAFKSFTRPYKDVVTEAVAYIDRRTDKKTINKFAQKIC